MNSSLLSADRNTHIKIVAVSFAAAIAVVAVAISARINGSNSTTAHIQADGPVVVKAGEPRAIAGNDNYTVR